MMLLFVLLLMFLVNGAMTGGDPKLVDVVEPQLKPAISTDAKAALAHHKPIEYARNALKVAACTANRCGPWPSKLVCIILLKSKA